MKYGPLFLLILLLQLPLLPAQVASRDTLTPYRHSVVFAAGYTLSPGAPQNHGMMIGAGYRFRVAPVYSFCVTVMAGPGFYQPFSASLESRLFADHEFRLRREHRVQPVFHIGTTQISPGNRHLFVFGMNMGAGAEVMFANRLWVAGLHARFTSVTTNYIPMSTCSSCRLWPTGSSDHLPLVHLHPDLITPVYDPDETRKAPPEHYFVQVIPRLLIQAR